MPDRGTTKTPVKFQIERVIGRLRLGLCHSWQIILFSELEIWFGANYLTLYDHLSCGDTSSVFLNIALQSL